MQPAVDPFHPLLRVIQRYRRDVHCLEAAPGAGVLSRAESYLGCRLPAGLAEFLSRWNGGDLFRGALRLRGAPQLAPAAADAPAVILFADGPGERRWAFVETDDGMGTLFGEWIAGQGFEPLHDRFERWLMATVRILDEDIREPHEQLSARLDADPSGPVAAAQGGRAAPGRGRSGRRPGAAAAGDRPGSGAGVRLAAPGRDAAGR